MSELIVVGLAGMLVFLLTISTFLEGLEIVLEPLFDALRNRTTDD